MGGESGRLQPSLNAAESPGNPLRRPWAEAERGSAEHRADDYLYRAFNEGEPLEINNPELLAKLGAGRVHITLQVRSVVRQQRGWQERNNGETCDIEALVSSNIDWALPGS